MGGNKESTDRDAGDDRFEDAAQAAAKAGKPVAMLEALGRGHFLDSLKRQIKRDWLRLDEDDADWIVGASVDALYDRIKGGGKVIDIFPYLVKTAHHKAVDLNQNRALESPYVDDQSAPENVVDDDRESMDAAGELRRGRMYGALNALVGRIAQDRPRQVIGYIVDAFSKGAYDVTNQEIATALNLSLGTVKVAKCRGFERLEDLAKEMGAVDFDFTLKDFELQDETVATTAAEEQGDL
jgi:hypothetical protein